MADTFLAYLHPNEIAATFHRSLMDLVGYDAANSRYLGPWAQVRCAAMGIVQGRNDVAAEFLQSDMDWLLVVDADMGFMPDSLDRLRAVAHPVHAPVVGGLCFAQREVRMDGLNGFRCEARPTIYDYIEHPDGKSRFTGRRHYPVNALTRCAATGAAFILIHRTVIERIHREVGPTWFDRIPGADGLLGEDISFCARVGAYGFPLHVHTGVRTTHFKNVWLGEEDFWDQYLAPPATERCTVIVPVLTRPQNVRPLVESLRASTGLAEALFVVEPDDIEEIDAITAVGARYVEFPGTFAQKVNHGYGFTDTPWVLLAGDDVVFRPGWLDHAVHVADKYDAKVVGTNDLGNPRVMAGLHATHMMIACDYIDTVGASWDGPGIICHEGYRHWYVDDEIVSAAKQRGVWAMALGSKVEHRHPIWGKAEDDDVYQLGQAASDADGRVFKARHKKYRTAA